MWYGMKIDGEIEYVLRWDHDGAPTLFDFNCGYSSSYEYEIVAVDIREIKGWR